MLSIKKLFSTFFLLVTLFSVSLTVLAVDEHTISGMAVDIDVTSVSFDKMSRKVELKSTIKNELDYFIGNLNYAVVAYKGEKINMEGDPFEEMELVFAKNGAVGDLYPNEKKDFIAEFTPPEGITSGNYFFLFSIGDEAHTYTGVDYNDQPLYLTGIGDYIGIINNSSFRTANGDDTPLYGAKTSINEKSSIIIPMSDNKKIDDYIKSNELYANVSFAIVASPDEIIQKYDKEKLQVTVENGKRIIKYNIKPWDKITPAPYDVRFSLVDKNGKSIAQTMRYRWWVEGAYTRLDTITSPQNFYEKGEPLNISVSMLAYDPAQEYLNKKAKLNIDLIPSEGQTQVFTKEVDLSNDIIISLSDIVAKEDILIKKINAVLVDDKGNEIDKASLDLDTSKVFSSSKVNYFFNLVIILVLVVLLALLFVFRKNKKTITFIVLAILVVVAAFFYVNNRAEADLHANTSISGSFNGSQLKFTVSCSACLNGTTISWSTSGGQSGSWRLGSSDQNSYAYVKNGSGCSASVSASNGSHCIGTSWSTNFCPVNGKCKVPAHNTVVSVKPTSNLLCSKGKASAVSGNNPWAWTCKGTNGGTTASCFTISSSTPSTPTCSDGIKNQDETGIDCGGAICPACGAALSATCSVTAQNNNFVAPSTLTWTANLANKPTNSTVSYNWSLSDGYNPGNVSTFTRNYAAGTYFGTTTLTLSTSTGSTTISALCQRVIEQSGTPCTRNCSHIVVASSLCGNGIKEASEQCDGTDGVGNGQICSGACTIINTPASCGDGLIQVPEECDNGSLNGTLNNRCSSLCTNIENLSCSVVRTGAKSDNKVLVNTVTQWKVVDNANNQELPATWSRSWYVNSVPAGNTTELDRIFTTVGLKQVSASVASTSGRQYYCSTNNSTATTSVVLSGATSEI